MRLLARLIPDGASGSSSVLGDLHEEYLEVYRRRGGLSAGLWYGWQVVALGTPWAFAAGRAFVAHSLVGLGLDFRASIRGLRRQPTLIAVSVLSLALGAGLVTAAATVVNGAWYAPLPWAASERMVDLADTHPAELPATAAWGTSLRAFETWRTDLPTGLFERLEAGERAWLPLRIEGGPASTVRAVRASAGYDDLLEFEPLVGRLLNPTDTEAGAEPVAVVSYGLWLAGLGGTPDAIGRTLRVDDVQHTVVGVLSPDARTLEDAELILPLLPAGPSASFDRRGVQVLGVLADGVSPEAANAALGSLASAMFAEATELTPGWSASVTPLRTVVARRGMAPTGAMALLLLCLVVLTAAALNLGSLLLARTTKRAREFGVRAAVGAGILQLARASLMDGLILAGAGGVLGLGVVLVARDAALARFGAEIPGWASFPIDLRVLVATAAGTTLAALIVGLFPMLRAVAIGRRAGLAPWAAGHSGRTGSRGHDILLGGQIALALILVAASAGALRTFAHASDFDRLGYRWDGLTSVIVSPGSSEGAAQTAEAAGTLDRAASAYTRIERHATSRPLSLVGADRADQGTTVRLGGQAEALPGASVPRSALAVGPGYFELNEIPIVEGRPITARDAAGSDPVAVVSLDAVRSLWPDRAPESVIGEVVELARGEVRTAFTVVGLAGEVVLDPTAAGGRTASRFYPAILQTQDALFGDGAATVELRVSPTGVSPTRQEWSAWVVGALPGAAISEITTVEDVLRQWVEPIAAIGAVLGLLSILVLALVTIGIYGTVSFRIASTRRDIGIRLALGAASNHVVGAVVRPLVWVVGWGTGVGVVLAVASGRVLASGGLPVGPTGVATLAMVAALMVFAAATASWAPLRRALAIDPSQSLREE